MLQLWKSSEIIEAFQKIISQRTDSIQDTNHKMAIPTIIVTEKPFSIPTRAQIEVRRFLGTTPMVTNITIEKTNLEMEITKSTLVTMWL